MSFTCYRDESDLNPEEQILLVLCGLPASGKTTLGNAIVRALEDYPIHIVSTDNWRDDTYYTQFTPEREQWVRRMAYEQTTRLLTAGQSVIHDDTNYYVSMRHELFRLTMTRGCRFGVIYVNTPLNVALRWNRQREREIPEQVILNIARKIDTPGERYAWDRPACVVDMSRIDLAVAVASVVCKLDSLRQPTQKRASPRVSDAAEIDVMTRRLISAFLHQHPELRNEPRIHLLRRSVLQDALRERCSVIETAERLKEGLRQFCDRV